MIRSERQYQVALQKLENLRSSSQRSGDQRLPAALLKAAKGQTAELAQEIEQEVRDYERLQKFSGKEIKIHSLSELRQAPIRFRMASGLTLEAFARMVEVHSRQIARYEAEEYQNVSIETLEKILDRIHLQIEGSVEIKRKSS